MVRLTREQIEAMKDHLDHCPTYDTRPWVSGPPLNQRRVAIIATSGVHMPTDRPFQFGQHDTYRVIPGNAKANDLVMSHGESSFDRTGFQRDGNMAFPIDRLRELAEEGVIGSLADFHYSFGAPMSDAEQEIAAREIADLLKKDNVTAALMCAPT